MEDKTKREHTDIGRRIAPLAKKGLKTEKPYAEMKEQLEVMKHSGKTLAERRLADRALNDEKMYNTYQRETKVVDPKVAKQIEREVDRMVKKQIDRNPERHKRDMRDYDAFMRKVNKR